MLRRIHPGNKTMINKTQKLPSLVLTYSLVIYLFIFAVLIGLAFGFSIPFSLAWGWLLGAFITVLNYGTILLQAQRIQARVMAKITTPYRGQGYALFRLVLSGLGMATAALLKPDGVEIFNLFSLFASYLIISLVIYVSGAQFRIGKTTV
jgi:hypothetical protein